VLRFATDAELKPVDVFGVDSPWAYADQAAALRGLSSTGNAPGAIEHTSEKAACGPEGEIENDPEAYSRHKRTSQERAVREVRERAERVRVAIERVRAEKEKRAKTHGQDEATKKAGPKSRSANPKRAARASRMGRSAQPTMPRSRLHPSKASLSRW
jgi:hypothetical protein